MKLTIDVDAMIAKLKDRAAREAALRRRGIHVLRDWMKRRAKKRRPSLTSSATLPRMRRILAGVLPLLCAACAASTPTQPTVTVPKAGVAASLRLDVVPGVGTAGGTATLTVTVKDAFAAPVAATPVIFTAASGSINSPILTNEKGIAESVLTAQAGSIAVSASVAGVAETKTIVAMQPNVVPITPTPNPPPPPQPGPGALSITLAAVTGTVGSSVVLQANQKNAVAPWRVMWTFGDGATGTGSSTSSAHTYTAIGTYPVSVTVSDDAGRSATATSTATIGAFVPPPPPAPSYTVTVVASPATVSAGGTSTLTATVIANNGAPTPTSFAWDCDNNGTIDFTTPGNSQSCTYTTAGTITSSVSVTGGTVVGSGSTTVAVAAQAPLVVGITGALTPAIGVSNNYTATVTSTGAVPPLLQWQWDDNNDGTPEIVIAASANPNVRAIAFGSNGAHTIKVTVTETATGRTAFGLLTVTVP